MHFVRPEALYRYAQSEEIVDVRTEQERVSDWHLYYSKYYFQKKGKSDDKFQGEAKGLSGVMARGRPQKQGRCHMASVRN